MKTLVTFTPSAAIDHTYMLPSLTVDHVNRATTSHTEISGKGVNVAQAAALASIEVSAVIHLHASDLELVEQSPAYSFIHASTGEQHTRINTTIIHDLGQTTKVNQAPVPLAASEWDALCQRTKDEVTRLDATWLVISGSVPTLITGETANITELLDWAQNQGVKTALDTSGPVLESILAQGIPITLVKPNTHELSELLRRPLRTIGEVVGAATELLAGALEIVYVSMGADGALCVANDGVWLARAAAARIVNTAGAGDASLAGFVTGLIDAGRSVDTPTSVALEGAISRASSWGALAVSSETTMLLSIKEAPIASTQKNPDPTQLLTDPANV